MERIYGRIISEVKTSSEEEVAFPKEMTEEGYFKISTLSSASQTPPLIGEAIPPGCLLIPLSSFPAINCRKIHLPLKGKAARWESFLQANT